MSGSKRRRRRNGNRPKIILGPPIPTTDAGPKFKGPLIVDDSGPHASFALMSPRQHGLLSAAIVGPRIIPQDLIDHHSDRYDDQIDELAGAYSSIALSFAPRRNEYVNPDYRIRHTSCSGPLRERSFLDSNYYFCDHCDIAIYWDGRKSRDAYIGFERPFIRTELASTDTVMMAWTKIEQQISVALIGPSSLITHEHDYSIEWAECSDCRTHVGLIFAWNIFKVAAYTHGTANNLGHYWDFMLIYMDVWLT